MYWGLLLREWLYCCLVLCVTSKLQGLKGRRSVARFIKVRMRWCSRDPTMGKIGIKGGFFYFLLCPISWLLLMLLSELIKLKQEKIEKPGDWSMSNSQK